LGTLDTYLFFTNSTTFSVIGIFLLIAGFSLLLLPLTLANSQSDQWRTNYIIAMIVVGGVLVIVFAVYERFLAAKPFIPYHLLTSRTVIGACFLDLTYQIAYYCWASYFTSFLQVVYDVSITEAGYINSIFDLVAPVWLLGAGFLMRHTQRFKWLMICAVPLYMLAVGLMIYFRTPGTSIGYLCMCEVFIGIGGGTIILGMQVAVMAASKHEDYAAMLALLSLFGNIGGAVGNSISGAIWTNTLPQKLQEYLPEDAQPLWEDIYSSLEVQLSYPVGSETRDAIIAAYAMAQRNMLIAGTAIMTLALGWVLLIKNIKLEDLENFRGVVF
jgi:MFS family permease